MASLVVVIIHAGAEGADRAHTPGGSEYYLGEDRGDARAFAHAVIEPGPRSSSAPGRTSSEGSSATTAI